MSNTSLNPEFCFRVVILLSLKQAMLLKFMVSFKSVARTQ